MKTNQILIVIGIIVLIIIIANWKKIIGNKNSNSTTTNNGTNRNISERTSYLDTNLKRNKCLNCISSFEQDLKGLSAVYPPPTSGPPSVTYNWANFSARLNQLKTCVS